MTMTLKKQTSEDKLIQVSFVWCKSNVYFVEVTQKYSKDSAYAHEIRRSRCYAMSEESLANQTFKRYCKRYL